MNSNIIDLSLEDEQDDLQMVSTRAVQCRESPKILGAVSSTTVNGDAATEMGGELCAPKRSSSEQAPSVPGLKLRSLDLDGSNPRSGLAMARAASAPNGGHSPLAAAGLHRFTKAQSSAPLMGKRLASAVAFSTKATALVAGLKAINGTSDVSADDSVTSFDRESQAMWALATGLEARAKSYGQHTSAVLDQPVEESLLPQKTATPPWSPEIVRSIPLADSFSSPAPKVAKTPATLQYHLAKPPSLPMSRNMTPDIHKQDKLATTRPVARSNDEAAHQALLKSLKEIIPGGKRCVSPLTQLHNQVPRKHKETLVQVPHCLDKRWLDDVPSRRERGLSPLIQSHNETLGKRKRVEAQAEASTVASPKRNRFLWSIPAYDPSKDPTMKKAPTIITAKVTPSKPPPAPKPGFAVPVQPAPTIQSKIGSDAEKGETTKPPASPKTTTTKSKLPSTARLHVPPNAPAAQESAFNIPSRTSTALPPVKESPSATTPAASSTSPTKKISKPWTSREYAELATLAFHSFPFAAFAATHNKTEREVFDTFSAIISLPIFQHSANGLARAKFARQKTAAFNKGLKDMKDMHRAEARVNALRTNRSAKRGGGVGGTEEDRMVLGGGVLGRAVAKGLTRG